MRVVLRDPPLFLMIAAIMLDLPLSRAPRQPTSEFATWPDFAEWPRRVFATLPPRSDPA